MGFTVKILATGNEVCVPTDLATLGDFQGVQRMVNNARTILDPLSGRIGVDGEIGEVTWASALALSGEVADRVKRIRLQGLAAAPTVLAANARAWTLEMGTFIGVAADFDPNPAQAPQIDIEQLLEDELNKNTPVAEGGGGIGTGVKIAAVGALALGLWWATRES